MPASRALRITMLRWPFRKKPSVTNAPGHSVADLPSDAAVTADPDDEWAFLRAQGDHDADEMSGVHGSAGAAEELDAADEVDRWGLPQAPVTAAALAPARVMAASREAPAQPELTEEDLHFGDMVHDLMDLSPVELLPRAVMGPAPLRVASESDAADTATTAAAPPGATEACSDVLDLALELGEAAGLLPTPDPEL